MCGFCGIMQERSPVDGELLTRMREKMRHRGPDEGKNFVDDDLLWPRFSSFEDHRPLYRRQPMSNRGRQPLARLQREIYNYISLRGWLKGHGFSSRSDSEVILHLYEERGAGMPAILRGIPPLSSGIRKGGGSSSGHVTGSASSLFTTESPGLLAFASRSRRWRNFLYSPE